MPDFDVTKDVLIPSIDLVRSGHPSEALGLIDKWIAKAEASNEATTIQILSVHATAIAESMGDFGLVKRYAERALAHESGHTLGKALALYKLADAMFHSQKVALLSVRSASPEHLGDLLGGPLFASTGTVNPFPAYYLAN